MTGLELYAWYGAPVAAFAMCFVLYLIARYDLDNKGSV